MAKRRIVVLHFVAQMPMAGIAWQALQYLVGLEELGYEAWYVENHGANPYDPRANSVVMDCAYNVGFLKESLERFGFAGRWAYWDAINDVYHGMTRERVFDLLKGADALINLCGATRLRDEHMACPVRIMVDTDPVYEQIKYAEGRSRGPRLSRDHTHFFTYGENVGGPGWIVPLCGIPWKPTRPPVVLIVWPEAPGAPPAFSTIATWENKGKDIEFEGERYVWSKHVNFLRFLDVPKLSGQPFAMAMLPPTPETEAEVTGRAGPSSTRGRFRRALMLMATSSAARAANSPSPRTSMCGQRAAGSAIAASAILPAAGRSSPWRPRSAGSIRWARGCSPIVTCPARSRRSRR